MVTETFEGPTKELWERGETRRIRPFADLENVLADVRLRLDDDADPIDRATIKAEDIDLDRLSPTVLLPEITEDRLNGAGIALPDMDLVVIVEDRSLKRSTVTHQYPATAIPPLVQLFPEARFAASWGRDTWLHVAFVLANEQGRKPGRPWRKGTWLARKTFSIAEPPSSFIFEPRPVPGSYFKGIGLPSDTTYLVNFREYDLDQPIEAISNVLEVLLHEDAFAALSQNPDGPSSRTVMAGIAADVIATTLAVGYGGLGVDDVPSENSILDVVTNRLHRSTGVSTGQIREFALEPGAPRLRALVQSEVRYQREVISATRRRTL